MPVGIITAVGTGLAAGGLGVGAGLVGALETGLIGAGIGAGTSAVFGRDPGKGALFGALGGVGQAVGPALGGALGIGDVGGLALTGAGTGALGQALTGGNVGQGALYGGLGGAASGLAGDLLSGARTGSTTGGTGTGTGGAAGASGAAATAVGTGTPVDLTSATPGIESITVSAAPNPAATSLFPAINPSATLGGGNSAEQQPGSPGPTGQAAALGNAGQSIQAGENLAAGSFDNPFPGNPISGTGPVSGAGGLAPTTPGSAVTSLPTGAGASTSLDDIVVKAQQPSTEIQGPTQAKPGIGQQVGNFVKNNPMATVAALGLGYQALNQPKLPSQSELTQHLVGAADRLGQQGAELSSYLNLGTLPPGAMAAVNQGAASAKATIKSRFASMGLSGSTSEASALASVDSQVATQVYEIANSLLQTGIKESQLSAGIYETLLKNVQANDQQMSTSIANFAAALAGGGNRKAAGAAT